MDKKKLLLMLGAMVIAVGTALAARSMLTGGAPAPTVQAAMPVAPRGPRVLVAQRALPPGTIITADALNFQEWPANMVRDAYFVDGKIAMNKLIGTVVRYPITAGQPITQGSLVAPGDRGFLAAALGPGMRAITITVSERAGVAGFVFPGDRVDVMLTQTLRGNGADGQALNATETILRNLRVLATDQSTSNESADGKAVVHTFHTVTLEVTPKIAEKIEVAQAVGALSLTLRSLADTQTEMDRALASGSAKTPDGASKDASAPIDSESTVTTGGEISRFQKRTMPASGPSASVMGAGGMPAPMMPAAIPAASRSSDHGVRVLRGRESQSVSFGPNGLAAQAPSSAPGISPMLPH